MKKNFFLSHHNYNLTKRWYIRFIEIDSTGRQVNGKTYDGINRGKTVEHRLELAKLAILRLEKEGTEIVQNEVNDAYFKVLDKIKPTLRPDSHRAYLAQTKRWLVFLVSLYNDYMFF